MGRLDDKVILVTGATGGIGEAQSALFVQEGASVVLTDIADQETGDAVARRLGPEQQAVYHPLDVTEEASWEAVVAKTVDQFGGLDVLVNTAGDWDFGTVEDCSMEEWQRLVALNQTGTFLGMKHAAPEMRRRGGGSIINVSSVWGSAGIPGAIAYQASKGAVIMLTKNAALTLAPAHVRVNVISPGIIETQHVLDFNSPGRNQLSIADTPLGRMGSPEDIAWASVYLASDESKFVTGIELVVDGGYLAH